MMHGTDLITKEVDHKYRNTSCGGINANSQTCAKPSTSDINKELVPALWAQKLDSLSDIPSEMDYNSKVSHTSPRACNFPRKYLPVPAKSVKGRASTSTDGPKYSKEETHELIRHNARAAAMRDQHARRRAQLHVSVQDV